MKHFFYFFYFIYKISFFVKDRNKTYYFKCCPYLQFLLGKEVAIEHCGRLNNGPPKMFMS